MAIGFPYFLVRNGYKEVLPLAARNSGNSF